MKKTNLTIEVILNKKFPTELSGYNAREVDHYLDQIIDDYKNYQSEIHILESKLEEKVALIDNREEEIQTLQIEIVNLKSQLKESSRASQYEILQEIKKLGKRKEENNG